MNPFNLPEGVLRQLFISEPFNNTIVVVDLTEKSTSNDGLQTVFDIGDIRRLPQSSALDLPIDMAPVQRNTKDISFASNTTLDEGSDIYVANRGNNTIVRMDQEGEVIAIRKVNIDGERGVKINGITTSVDGSKIYITFVNECGLGGVAKLNAF